MSPRIFLAIVLSILILGGAALFLGKKQTTAKALEFSYTQAAKNYALELTPTFSLAKDPFALKLDDNPALIVRLGEQELLRLEGAPPGESILLEDVQGLVHGINEFFIKAFPAVGSGGIAQALRVRLLENGHPVAEQSFWTGHGMPVQSVLRIMIEEPDKGSENGH